jgi:serine/threonine protein kinase
MEQIEQVHGYQIIKNIGFGSFGNVFEVKSVDTGHHFAMKVYKKPFKSAYSCR